MLLLLISPTVYTIAIFQPGIYTEQGWKMTIVYTVGEIRKIKSKYTQNKVGR
jgi:hypothetical protein